MRALILALPLLLAGACAAAAPDGPDALTPAGWGPLRIDMNRAEVEAARGLRFEIGLDRRVEIIHAGGPSIQYVEGCA